MSTVLLLASCGGGGGGPVGVAMYTAKCMTACTASDGPCAGKAATECQQDCTMQTAGLGLQCAQCLIEHTGWSTTTCVCDMTGCKTCGKSPGFMSQPCTGGENFTCDPGTTCTGYRIGTPSDCPTLCTVKASDEVIE